MTQRSCSDCPTPIGARNPSGRCRKCAARVAYSDPKKQARRLEALRIALNSPATRATKCRAAQKRERDRRDDPAWRAYKVASGRRLQADYQASPDGQARNAAKRALVGRKISQHRLGWCPPDRRDEYTRLRKMVGAPEARRIIEADLSPFERQLASLARGVKLIAKPDLRPIPAAMTLGGIATGQL